jgi:integrase
MAPIKKFYETNDIELKWTKIKSYVGKGKGRRGGRKDRPYTVKEISKMLEKADQRGKVAILLMCSSGIRVGALSSLKIRNLEKIDRYSIYKITVYENEDEEYVTFCTPECASTIDSYLEYRQRHGERPLKEDSPLIREEFDINDEIIATRPKSLRPQTFQRMVNNAGFRSGVIEKHASLENFRGHRRPVKETHGFRKFFQTTAINAGMSPLYSEFILGHRSGSLALESYVRPTENDLLEGNDKMVGYIGIIGALTINEENKLRREVQSLKQEVNRFDKMAIFLVSIPAMIINFLVKWTISAVFNAFCIAAAFTWRGITFACFESCIISPVKF